MHRIIKKYLIPHKDNNYKPHLFREAGAGVLFSIVIALFIFAVFARIVFIRTNFTALVLPKVLVDYANEDRSTEKYNKLSINPLLEKAAQLKANDMAEKGYFAHKSPEGLTPWYWFKQVGYDFSYAGENLAVNFNDSVDVNKAWMASPGHRANIMNGNFSEIGIATAEGMYQGRRTIFVVELFGRPAKNITTSSKTEATTPKAQAVTTKSPAVTPIVLSESVSSEVSTTNGANELFIAVEKESATTSVSNEKYSNFLERALMSPGKFVGFIYLILSIIILIGLASMLFIEIEKQHPRYILIAIGLLIVIIGLYYIYKTMLVYPVSVA